MSGGRVRRVRRIEGTRSAPGSGLGDLAPVRLAPELEKLYRATSPIAGRPGWRLDRFGRTWYSAEWL